MESLEYKLRNISDSYQGFVMGMITYAKEAPEKKARLETFLEQNPQASASDIIEYVCSFPDFFDHTIIPVKAVSA